MPRIPKRDLFTPEQREHLKLVREGRATSPGPQAPRPEKPKKRQQNWKIRVRGEDETPTNPEPRLPNERSAPTPLKSFLRRGRNNVDLTGKRYGRWLVLGITGRRLVRGKPIGPSLWRCQCDCGTIKERVLYQSLTSGHSTSCGCFHKEDISKRTRTKRFAHPREYRIWQGMKTRCHNPNHHTYWRYGAKGITVCTEWLTSFEAFFRDMGPCPPDKHSVDRYPNRHGNYEPGNCRWATHLEQAENKDPSNTTQRDLYHEKFGMLKVGTRRRCSGHQAIWNCVCDCGEAIAVRHSLLTTGKARSCGCHQGEPRKYHTDDSESFRVKRPDIAARAQQKKVAPQL